MANPMFDQIYEFVASAIAQGHSGEHVAAALIFAGAAIASEDGGSEAALHILDVVRHQEAEAAEAPRRPPPSLPVRVRREADELVAEGHSEDAVALAHVVTAMLIAARVGGSRHASLVLEAGKAAVTAGQLDKALLKETCGGPPAGSA